MKSFTREGLREVVNNMKTLNKIEKSEYRKNIIKQNKKCIFWKEGKCKSDYSDVDCDGLNVPESCPYDVYLGEKENATNKL